MGLIGDLYKSSLTQINYGDIEQGFGYIANHSNLTPVMYIRWEETYIDWSEL